MNLQSKIDFDPSTHVYKANGQRIPSVTQILKGVGIIPPSFGSYERGSAVHLATQYYDDGTLDESSIDDVVMPFLIGYKKFLSVVKPKWELIEYSVHNPIDGYAGTFDRFGIVLGKRMLIDIKTNCCPEWAGIQMAGYANCLTDVQERRVLTLKPNDYKLSKPFPSSDFKYWFAALGVYTWRKYINREDI